MNSSIGIIESKRITRNKYTNNVEVCVVLFVVLYWWLFFFVFFVFVFLTFGRIENEMEPERTE